MDDMLTKNPEKIKDHVKYIDEALRIMINTE